MEDIILSRIDNETPEECLWRLGCIKNTSHPEITWNQITDFLNTEFNFSYDESTCRKRFKKLQKATAIQEIEAIYNGDYSERTKDAIREIEKQRIRVNEEKSSYRRILRNEATRDSIFNELRDCITRAEPVEVQIIKDADREKAMYAILSDIHYGLSFSSFYSSYNPTIATNRVMKYAERLCEIGRQNHIARIYVSLLGDLISGGIHQSIRLENRKNVIAQIVEVSELISAFLQRLANSFEEIIVTDVAGNHSRLEQNAEDALRAERLDILIPWYCKAKLETCKNIRFLENTVDPTVSVLDIFGKTYVAVHGDFDPDLKVSALKLAQLIGKRIHYMIAGHMHIMATRFEDVGFIRNGAVVTGGDEYTAKKRLFGPAMQVCMIVSSNGVESIYPVAL